MTNPDYFLATNKAYEVLNNFRDFSYPTPIYSIIQNFHDIILVSYEEFANRCNQSFSEFYKSASSEFGFSIKDISTGHTIILYNNHKDETTNRFTLAHELGHFVLNHYEDNSTEDKEANCFARNLLCPVPIVTELSLSTIYEYVNNFYVSTLMARTALDFRKRDYNNITTANYNLLNDKVMCFLNGVTMSELYGHY